MTIHVEIPEPLAGQVERAARSQGKSPQDLVLETVANGVDPLAWLKKLSEPIQARMQELGITEEEAAEDFEAEKHAMRRERRAAKQ